MSAVAEELQLESEQQYNNEKLMPEVQLLERPFDIINTLQQAAQEGIVPQVADAISLAHLPNPGFKITHEIKPHAQTEPNDGMAAIVAGICGVTKSCEDRCCPIGDLDKARVRVSLINELKLNDPDFFNNPNADKIIKDRVNEIMDQKQQLAQENPNLNNQSSPEITDKPIKEATVDIPVKEQPKKKVEVPTSFFGRQLSPQEAEQKMKELSGTYSQGKKTVEPETLTKLSEGGNEVSSIKINNQTNVQSSEEVVIKPSETKPDLAVTTLHTNETTAPITTEQAQQPAIPDHIKSMLQDKVQKQENTQQIPTQTAQTETVVKPTSVTSQELPVVEKPVQSITTVETISVEQVQRAVSPITTEQRTTIHESTSSTISQERIERHRPKIQKPENKPTTSEPTEQLQPEIIVAPVDKPIPINTLNHPLTQPEIHIPKPVEQTVQPPIPSSPQEFQQSPIEIMPQTITIPREFRTIDSHLQRNEEQKPSFIMPTEQIKMPSITETIQFADIAVMTGQQREPVITIPIDNVQSNKLVDLEQTITIPVTETSVPIPQTIPYESIEPTKETIIITGQLEQPSLQVDTIITNRKEFAVEDIQVINSEEILQQIVEPTNIEKTDVEATFQEETTTTIFSYSEPIQEPITQIVELSEATEQNFDTNNPTQIVTEIPEVQIDDLQITEQVLEDINTSKSVTLVDSSESLLDGSDEIIQPATLETFTQILTELISDQKNISEQHNLDDVTTDIFPGQTEEQMNDAIEHDVIFDLEPSENNIVEISQPVDLVTFLESTTQDLPNAIESIIQETGTVPFIVLALHELVKITDHSENIITTETTMDQSGEPIDKVNLEETNTESFILYMLNQEQLISFVHLIQQITDVMAFLHSYNNGSNRTETIEEKEMNVTPEELKNDTFGKYDDTVVMTIWPIVQFMLYIQEMQIFLPQKSQLTTVT